MIRGIFQSLSTDRFIILTPWKNSNQRETFLEGDRPRPPPGIRMDVWSGIILKQNLGCQSMRHAAEANNGNRGRLPSKMGWQSDD